MHDFHQEVTFKQYFHLHQQFMFLFANCLPICLRFFLFFLCVCLEAGYKTRSWSWSWSFTRSRTSTAPFYRTPPLIGCLDTATAPDIDLGVQLPAFDVLFVLNIARRQSEMRAYLFILSGLEDHINLNRTSFISLTKESSRFGKNIAGSYICKILLETPL